MKKVFIISFLCVLIAGAKGKENFLKFPLLHSSIVQDTVPENIAEEDSLIEEVIKTRTLPKKDKVQYFNQVTKYGFKNLFSNYSYNASMPYTAQVNPNAESFVQDYIKAHNNYLQNMKGWGKPYFNLIENILQQYGLPKELKYIAVIESNLSTGATSVVGAGGPWQFMPYTAKDYGLVVNGALDERRDYYKSTHAAARYLLYLYSQLHDWLLVMAAYNGGPGRVYSAIKKSGSNDFWRLQYYLPEESRTYVKRFIATHYIMEGGGGITTFSAGVLPMGNDVNRTTYGRSSNAGPFKTANLTTDELVDVEVLSITGKYNSLIIAKNIMMDIALFNHFNPSFDATMSVTGNFDLRLPPDKMQLFTANKYQILNESVQALLGDASVPDFKTVYPVPGKKKTR
ncbi:lytic transglycosylase domain-containing protein [Ferruginibacter paludis]|uniref:lytic transglycosylase domain-containing protein n=1 Tax=Ferruginibacter paludis TaxID=1310417 RepID=UPI0025B5314A|nr:lytic transglycosylase domain-containing protein [Ferruginibacter paludis]MDN3657674.1 lytic transglycosylase domain-containing protein [Ferruginibacter paludis]